MAASSRCFRIIARRAKSDLASSVFPAACIFYENGIDLVLTWEVLHNPGLIHRKLSEKLIFQERSIPDNVPLPSVFLLPPFPFLIAVVCHLMLRIQVGWVARVRLLSSAFEAVSLGSTGEFNHLLYTKWLNYIRDN